MRRSSESSDPRRMSLHRRVSLLRRSEVGNAAGSGSILDDDTNADWNEIEPQWWKRLDKGPDKRASANFLPVNRPNTQNYSDILVEESCTVRISVVEDGGSDDSTFDSVGSLPTMSPIAFTKKKGLFQKNLKKKMGALTSKVLLALPTSEMPTGVEQSKTLATDSDADSYLESLHFHSKIYVDPQEKRNLRARSKNLFKNKQKNNQMTFSKAVDTSSKDENNSESINENQSIPILKKPNLSQKQSKKLFKKKSKPRNSLFADALSHLESDGSVKGDEDLESDKVNKPPEVETISKPQETLKRRASLGSGNFSQRRMSDAESVKSGYHEYSPSSVVSETINFDRWKQLASSTMLEVDKSPKTMDMSNFKGSKQSLSDKLAMLHSDIMEEKETSNPNASKALDQGLQPNVETNADLHPAGQPKAAAILLEEVLVESQVKTRRSSRLSNSPAARKSTVLQYTPDVMRNVKYSETYLEDAFGISKINEINKSEGPVLSRDDAIHILPKNQSQRQSIGTWLQLEESDEEISPPLSQSDVDRQVIEEMMAKRTNPPVRRSTHFSKQNFQDMPESDVEMHQTHESSSASIEGGGAEKLNASTDKHLATDKYQLRISTIIGDEIVPETLPIVQSSVEENKKSISDPQKQVDLQILDIPEKSELNINVETEILGSNNGMIADLASLHGSPIRSESRKSQALTAENSDSLNISLNRSRKLQNSSQQGVKDNHPDWSKNKSVSTLTGTENVPETLPIDQSNVEENKSIYQSQEQVENLQILDIAEKSELKINVETEVLESNTEIAQHITTPHGSPIRSESRRSQPPTTENSDSLNRSRKLQNSSQQSLKDNHADWSRTECISTLIGDDIVPEILPIVQSSVEENKKSISDPQKQVDLQILDIPEKSELNINVETEILGLNNGMIADLTSPHGSPIRSESRKSQALTTENYDSSNISLNRSRKLQNSSQQSVKDNHPDWSRNKSVSTLTGTENAPETLPIDQSNVKGNKKSISDSQEQVENLQILNIAEKSELNINVEIENLEPNNGIIADITSPHGSPIRSESHTSRTLTTENSDSSNIFLNQSRKKQNSSQRSVHDNHPDWLVERPLKIVAHETSLSSSTHAYNSDYPNISTDASRNTFNSTLRNTSVKDIWKDSMEEQVTPLKHMTPNISLPTKKHVPNSEDFDSSANISDTSRKVLNSAKRRATDIWQDSVEDQVTLTPVKTMATTTHFEDNSISILTPAGPNPEPLKSIHHVNVSAKRKFTEEELKEFADKVMSDNAKQAKIVDERLANRFTFQPYLSKNIPKAVQVKQKPMAKSNVPREPRILKPKNTGGKMSKKPYMKEQWITQKLYNFVEKKLKPQYGLKSLLRTEKFIKDLACVVNVVLNSKGGHHHYVDTLKREMARLRLVTTYFDFCSFIHEYLPFYFRIKSIAAEGRDVPEFTGKVFAPILDDKKKK